MEKSNPKRALEELQELLQYPSLELEEVVMLASDKKYEYSRVNFSGSLIGEIGRDFILLPVGRSIEKDPVFEDIQRLMGAGVSAEEYHSGERRCFSNFDEEKFNLDQIFAKDLLDQFPEKQIKAPIEVEIESGRKTLRFFSTERIRGCFQGEGLFLGRNGSCKSPTTGTVPRRETKKYWCRVQAIALYLASEYPKYRTNISDLMKSPQMKDIRELRSSEREKRRFRSMLREVVPLDSLLPLKPPLGIFSSDGSIEDRGLLAMFSRQFGIAMAMDKKKKLPTEQIESHPGLKVVTDRLSKDYDPFAVHNEVTLAFATTLHEMFE